MRILVTGMNGTVAPAVANRLKQLGHEVVAWDRNARPIGTKDEILRALESYQPNAVFHFAMGSVLWASWMAEWCAAEGRGYLHCSSVSVFGENQVGPFSRFDLPTPTDDYGRYKLEGEMLVAQANPEVAIFRIGWQIGDAPGSNNMVDFFHKQVQNDRLELSTNWFPGSSTLEATAECLVRHFLKGERGLFHVDGNPGLSLFQIAEWTARRLSRNWNVVPVEEPHRNTLMTDSRVVIQPLPVSRQPSLS